MSAQHTPGPWTFDDKSGDAGGLVVWAANGDRVARVCWFGDQSETPWATEANARLIAAAPDLLRALRELCRTELFLGDHPQRLAAFDAARAAVAKAAGSAS